MAKQISKPRGMKLKNIPDDIHKILVKEQGQHKANTGLFQFSVESTIYKIIREWERCLRGEKV